MVSIKQIKYNDQLQARLATSVFKKAEIVQRAIDKASQFHKFGQLSIIDDTKKSTRR